MRAPRMWYALAGHIRLEVTGVSCERFVNLAVARGVLMWDIRRIDRLTITARVGVRAYKPLRRIAGSAGCHVRIVSRHGLPFAVRAATSRPGLMCGLACALAVVWALSMHVWFIDVVGERGGSATTSLAIRAILRESGVRVGCLRSDIGARSLEQLVLRRRSDLAWAGVTQVGTHVTVAYVRKILPPQAATGASDVVATKACVITAIIPFKGVAVANEGMAVMPGQVLIAGRGPDTALAPTVESDQAGSPTVVPGQRLRAMGMVEGRVAYEGYGEARLETPVTRETGSRARVWVLRLGHRALQFGNRPSFRDPAVRTKRVFGVGWRNGSASVELSMADFRETTTHIVRISQAMATRRARAAAVRAAQRQIPTNARTVSTRVTAARADPSGTAASVVRYDAVIETIESVGRDRLVPRSSSD